MHRARPSRGFTVIELLVVMGVISVLASILLPALSVALRSSRAAICTANEHQILAAMTSYSGDNSGFMVQPGQAFAMDDVGVADFNVGCMWPYLDPSAQTRAQIMHCPDDDFENMPTYNGVPHLCYRNFSYSINISTINMNNSSWVYMMQLRQVKNLDKHVWIYEEFAPNDQYNYGPTDVDDLLTGRHGPYGAATAQRSQYTDTAWKASGKGNVGYFDGHVSMMTVETYYTQPYYHFGPLTQ